MSNLVDQKMSEANSLVQEAEREEAEGAEVTSQIEALTERGVILMESARAKRAFGEAQRKTAESLGGTIVATSPKKGRLTVVAPPVASEVPKAAKAGKVAKAEKAAKTAKVAKAATEQAAPVAVPKKQKTAKATKATTVKLAEQRVAGDDKMPPLHERLKIVMGNDDVTIPQAIERLSARDASWVPESTDLKAYISLALSTHVKDLFDRVSRGVYCVKKDPTATVKKDAPVKKDAVASVKKAGQAQKANGGPSPASNGTGIEDLGTNVMASPFTGAAA